MSYEFTKVTTRYGDGVKRIYCFDLDGTLCLTTDRDYVNAEPLPDRIAEVNALYDEGHTIIIDTARGTVTGFNWEATTRLQLGLWGVKFHHLHCGRKPYADHYIDDHGVPADEFFHA